MTAKLLLIALLLACHCYNASAFTKIVGGQNAYDGQFPYIVSLRQDGTHLCGGSILTPRTIITVAHCNVHPISTVTAFVGTNTLSSGGVSHKLTKFVNHEEYENNKNINDIALVILATSITYNALVEPIALPTINLEAGVDLVTAGWGHKKNSAGVVSENLQFINTRTITLLQCSEITTLPIHISKICTEPVNGEGICLGDSGGPLVRDNTLVGLSVSSRNLCGIGWPDEYTRVYYHKDWISSNLVY